VEARLANIPPCLIGMEACVGAHHLSRKLASPDERGENRYAEPNVHRATLLLYRRFIAAARAYHARARKRIALPPYHMVIASPSRRRLSMMSATVVAPGSGRLRKYKLRGLWISFPCATSIACGFTAGSREEPRSPGPVIARRPNDAGPRTTMMNSAGWLWHHESVTSPRCKVYRSGAQLFVQSGVIFEVF
jgi:hypothetical protein